MGFTIGAIFLEGVAEAAVAAEIAAAAMTVGEVAASSALIAVGTDVAGMAALDAAAMATAGEVGLTAGVEAAGAVGMDAAAGESGLLAVGADGADAASLAGNGLGESGLSDLGAGATNSATDASLSDVGAQAAADEFGNVPLSQAGTAQTGIDPATAAANEFGSVPASQAGTAQASGTTSLTPDVSAGSTAGTDPGTTAANEFGTNPVNQYGTGASNVVPTPAGFSNFMDYMKAAAKFAKANPLVTSVGMQVAGGALKGMNDTSTANKNRAVLQQTADINAAKVKQGSYGSDVAGYTPIIASRRI